MAWLAIGATGYGPVYVTPPSVETKDSTLPSKPLSVGMTTWPFGWTSGWPPMPAWPDAVVFLVPQVSPPSVDVLIWIRLPWALLSHST